MNFESLFISETNWDAIGAIGQWVGALAAAGAVWWGIVQTKRSIRPKAKLGVDTLSHPEGDILRVFAINRGHSLVRFTNAHIKHSKTGKYVLGHTFYRDGEREPVETNERKTHGFEMRQFQSEAEKEGLTGLQKFILEFSDSSGRIFTKKFTFDFSKNEVT